MYWAMTEYEDFVMSGEGSAVSQADMHYAGHVLSEPMGVTNTESKAPLE